MKPMIAFPRNEAIRYAAITSCRMATFDTENKKRPFPVEKNSVVMGYDAFTGYDA
jgi:hypothetical protein